MTQEWMNKEDADSWNLIDVANDFYTGGSHRLSKFGHFSTYAKHLGINTILIETTIFTTTVVMLVCR